MKMQSDGQGYRSMAENEDNAALYEGATLPKTLDLVADDPNWTVPE